METLRDIAEEIQLESDAMAVEQALINMDKAPPVEEKWKSLGQLRKASGYARLP